MLRNFNRRAPLVVLLCLGASFGAASIVAQENGIQPTKSARSTDGAFTFEIQRLQRVASDRVGLTVRIRMDGPNAPELYMPPGVVLEKGQEPVYGYSPTGSFLVDESTGERFAETIPGRGDPYFGTSDWRSVMRKGGSAMVGLYLKAPPPPDPNLAPGSQPVRKFALVLPGTAGPIRGIILPDAIVRTLK